MVRFLLVGASFCSLVALAAAADGQPSNPSPQPAAVVHPEIWPEAAWPVKSDARSEARIASLLKRMTLEEKVGQILQADIASVTPDDVHRYHLGSVLNGGNSGPYGDDRALPPKWLQLADEFYAASVDRSGGGVGIPIIWGTDAVHGDSNIIGATLFPHNIGLGAAHDPDLIERIGAATAAEIRVTGQEWTFAPTVTVPQDFRWGRAYEGYSSDPALVASYGRRMILGLQGAPNSGPLLKGLHVLASTKHFLADGGTFEGRDQGDARISEVTLRDIHGRPYIPAIEAGVETVMASFSSWQGMKLAGNRGLLTDVLKGRMHFGGFIVTDWNAHALLPGCSPESCPQVLNAGVDMYMAPNDWKALYASLIAQVKEKTIPMARLDDAVSRILRVKMQLGLFEAGKPSSRPGAGQWATLGSPEHRAIAREAVAKSLVLLKNQGVLPLKPSANILVAGDGADDVARQSGGWTISWQGTGVPDSQFPGTTTLLAGMRAAVEQGGGHLEYAPDGHFTHKPDAAIVVFGETPYAEFQGDLKTLQLRPGLRKPLETMRRLKAAGIPVVAVMLTGRPLFVSPEINAADAFVVAWLPGSEGAGVADRLFAPPHGAAPGFTGRLPARWPVSALPDSATLFPLGFGLSGSETVGAWRPLNEDPGIVSVDTGNILMSTGEASAGWSLQVSDGQSTPARIVSLPAEALGGRIKVEAIDHLVQEGARRFTLAGGGMQRVELGTQDPIDLTRERNGDIMVVFTARFETPIPAGTMFGMRCGEKCEEQIPFAAAAVPLDKWTTVGVPLKCFSDMKIDTISAPFGLQTKDKMRFSIANIALGSEADVTIACPPTNAVAAAALGTH
jgi:beta-glucosidase